MCFYHLLFCTDEERKGEQKMGLELFNKTNRVKELPKYNYSGKFKLGPGMSYPIKDYMTAFYKPFEKVGVITRRSLSTAEEVIEPEVKKILDESVAKEEIKKAENTQEPTDTKPEEVTKDSASVESSIVEDVVKEEPEVHSEETVSTKKPYTEEELTEIKMNDLRSILQDLGIDPESVKYKKSEYIKAILETQK